MKPFQHTMRARCARWGAAVIISGGLFSACGDDEPTPGPSEEIPLTCEELGDVDRYEALGDLAVGSSALTLHYGEGISRDLHVWYPAAEPGPQASFIDFIRPDERARFEAEASETPAACLVEETAASLDLTPATGTRPLLVFSHCLGCVGPSMAKVFSTLASHGFVVAAVTHDDTSWYAEDGSDVAHLNTTELASRSADLIAALDVLTATPSTQATLQGELADAVLAQIDAERVGLFGHSFGSITSANVVTLEEGSDRVHAWVGIAAPPGTLTGPKVSDFHLPSMMVIAEEDNSITAVGNYLMEQNWERIPGPKFLLSFADMGHFNFTHLTGLGGNFVEGCGEGLRQTNGQPFTYMPPEKAMEDLSSALVAFFDHALRGSAEGSGYLRCVAPASVRAKEARP